MDIRKVKKLIELLDETGVAEIEIKEGEESVRISRHPTGAVHTMAPPSYVYAPPAAAAPAAPAAAAPAPSAAPAAKPRGVTDNQRSELIALDWNATEPAVQSFRIGLADLALNGDPFVSHILLAAELPHSTCAQALSNLAFKCVATRPGGAAATTLCGVNIVLLDV